MEKDIYIKENFNIDYILKSKQAGLSLIFVILIFSFLHTNQTQSTTIIKFFCFIGMLLSFLRFHNANRFINKKIDLNRAVNTGTFLVISSAITWSTLGTLSILSYDKLQVELLTTFILLNAFSSGSIVTLATKRSQLLIFNFLLLSPQVFYSFWEYERSKNANFFWLIAYAILNFVYTNKQSMILTKELEKRFQAEFDLKNSLIVTEAMNKKLEEETLKTFHASRLSSLGEMASGVAHEINNPLTIIQGMTKNILGGHEHNIEESIKIKLQKVYSASERIAKIVKGMKLISSKSDVNEHEVITIKSLLETNIDLFEEKFKHDRINFTYINPLNPSVKCNPSQILQLIMNLIANAIDALNCNSSEKNLLIIVNLNDDQNIIESRVVNSGPLINDEITRKLFEPFFTTKDPGHGTGLGLSISKRLAQNNGGNLYYEVYNGEVCFTLQLPLFKT